MIRGTEEGTQSRWEGFSRSGKMQGGVATRRGGGVPAWKSENEGGLQGMPRGAKTHADLMQKTLRDIEAQKAMGGRSTHTIFTPDFDSARCHTCRAAKTKKAETGWRLLSLEKRGARARLSQ